MTSTIPHTNKHTYVATCIHTFGVYEKLFVCAILYPSIRFYTKNPQLDTI